MEKEKNSIILGQYILMENIQMEKNGKERNIAVKKK